MKLANICPRCGEPLSAWACSNEDCKSCTKEAPYPRLVTESKDDETVSCPLCGFTECFSFWEVQNIELFITTQLAGMPGGLTKAAKVADRRKNETSLPNDNDQREG